MPSSLLVVRATPVPRTASRKKVVLSVNNVLYLVLRVQIVLSKDAFVDGVLPFLLGLAQSACLFLITQCDNLDVEKYVLF